MGIMIVRFPLEVETRRAKVPLHCTCSLLLMGTWACLVNTRSSQGLLGEKLTRNVLFRMSVLTLPTQLSRNVWNVLKQGKN